MNLALQEVQLTNFLRKMQECAGMHCPLLTLTDTAHLVAKLPHVMCKCKPLLQLKILMTLQSHLLDDRIHISVREKTPNCVPLRHMVSNLYLRSGKSKT